MLCLYCTQSSPKNIRSQTTEYFTAIWHSFLGKICLFPFVDWKNLQKNVEDSPEVKRNDVMKDKIKAISVPLLFHKTNKILSVNVLDIAYQTIVWLLSHKDSWVLNSYILGNNNIVFKGKVLCPQNILEGQENVFHFNSS